MAQKLNYVTLDVFTTKTYSGNQLGLVLVPKEVTLTQEQKQHIAIEFNYSETVILHERSSEDGNDKYQADIYTPKSEIPFAGHPTIGTAVWIFTNLEGNSDTTTLKLKAGDCPITFDRGSETAAAAIPHDVHIHQGGISWDRVVESQAKLVQAPTERQSQPVPLVSIVPGMNFALVDLSTQPDLLNHIVVTKNDIPKAEDLDEGWPATLLGNLFFYIKADQGDGVIRIRQRMMALDLEDPATGSASATLATYLSLLKGEGDKTYKFELEQGVEMDRASIIFVAVTLTEDGKGTAKVVLSGQAVEMMKGSIRL